MTSAELPFTVQHSDGIHFIEFRHDLHDPMEVERSNQELHMLVEAAAQPCCVLSLRNVQTITSKLLGIIMGLDLKILRKHGQLRLCNIGPRVHEVFTVTRLHEILQLHQTKEDAM